MEDFSGSGKECVEEGEGRGDIEEAAVDRNDVQFCIIIDER
jgi:hypothetical protein